MYQLYIDNQIIDEEDFIKKLEKVKENDIGR